MLKNCGRDCKDCAWIIVEMKKKKKKKREEENLTRTRDLLCRF